MFARIINVRVPLERVEEGRKMLEEQMVPRVRELPGLRNAYWLLDRQTGVGRTIFLYDTAEAMQAAEEQGKRMREQAQQQIGVAMESIEEYEVIAST
jgi:hypothetical protein